MAGSDGEMNYQTALVTGASRGIGAAICRRLRALGLEVHAVARNREALDRLAADTGAIVHVADITDVEAVMESLGDTEIDVLVNNAGAITAINPLHAQSKADIDSMLEVNLRAPLQLMRTLLPGMLARRRGHIFVIGSILARYAAPGAGTYAAAKSGLSAALRSLRYDIAGSAVRITEIAPGRVETDIYRQVLADDPDKLAALYRKHRALQPDDVAELVATAVCLPARATLTYAEVMPTDQAMGGMAYSSAE